MRPSHAMPTSRDSFWDDIDRFLAVEALRVLGEPLRPASSAYEAFCKDRTLTLHWWQCALDVDWKSRKRVERAIERFVRHGRWPPLPIDDRCVISLRLRLASRIARSLRSRAASRQRSWFPSRLRSMSPKGRLRWLLIEAWHLFAAEIFDESAEWSDEVGGVFFPKPSEPPPGGSPPNQRN